MIFTPAIWSIKYFRSWAPQRKEEPPGSKSEKPFQRRTLCFENNCGLTGSWEARKEVSCTLPPTTPPSGYISHHEAQNQGVAKGVMPAYPSPSHTQLRAATPAGRRQQGPITPKSPWAPAYRHPSPTPSSHQCSPIR